MQRDGAPVLEWVPDPGPAKVAAEAESEPAPVEQDPTPAKDDIETGEEAETEEVWVRRDLVYDAIVAELCRRFGHRPWWDRDGPVIDEFEARQIAGSIFDRLDPK